MAENFCSIVRVIDGKFDWSRFNLTFELDGQQQTFHFKEPRQMFSTILNDFERYCVNDATHDLNMIIYEDVELKIIKSEFGTWRVDLRLLHMDRPWLGIIVNTWEEAPE